MIEGGEIEDIKYYTNKVDRRVGEIRGEKVMGVGAKGKILWLEMGNRKYIHIHFGITGWIEIKRPERNIKYEIRIRREGREIKLYMEDRRRFSSIRIYEEEEHKRVIGRLGEDIFKEGFTLEYFRKVMRSRRTYIGSLIMEQGKIAGIGNYIKNEALYMSDIEGRARSNEIGEEKIGRLPD